MASAPFSIAAVEALRARIDPWIARTPAIEWNSDAVADRLGPQTRISLKLELLQRTGSFKPRGALAVMADLSPPQLARGVTTVSAGNHAIATAYAAKCLGASAKVVMLRSANPARVEASRRLGAAVEIAADGASAFARAQELERIEGRTVVHPFEGPLTTLGTATIGLEWHEQSGELDAVIVPIGGGGLCSGLAWALRLLQPRCAIYGVEPDGADNMARSLAAGEPVRTAEVRTIADSLGPPYSLPYSFDLCRRVLDDVVRVSDDALCAAMHVLFREARLAVEPAAAAATAALLGPLSRRLAGQRVGVIACGANIDLASFSAHAQRGERLLAEATPFSTN
jgi:threonine dehydratase